MVHYESWFIVSLISIGGISIVLLTASVPSATPAQLQTFFSAALQVNAVLLVAVFVEASFVVPRLPKPPRERYGAFFALDTVLFFLGLLDCTWGMLTVPAGLLAATAVASVLVIWLLGVSMLLDGIGVTRLVKA
jgi:hypothetical protein